MISALFNTFLHDPILNLLIGVYNVTPFHDFGIAVIVVTLIIKLVLYPLTASSLKSQKSLQDLQPKIQEIRSRLKDKPQEMAQETMKLYRENKVSPFSSCLPVLIQLPILLALYWSLRDGLNSLDVNRLYSFVAHPDMINPIAFGFMDLSEPSLVVAALAGVTQYLQARMMTTRKGLNTPGAKDENMMAMMNKNMLYMMPVITVLIGATLPAALTLYWFVSTLITWLQQIVLFRKMDTRDASPLEQ